MSQSLADLRSEYTRAGLAEAEAGPEPFTLARRWIDEAIALGLPEPTAMTLATVDGEGLPSARVVLLKGFDDTGLRFFSNYLSRKGEELSGTPRAAAVIFWPPLERQLRFEGLVERLPSADSDAYFASRPRASQLGAVVSAQSRPIHSRAALEEALEQLKRSVGEGPIERPAHWGGYLLRPLAVELWQGRRSRLHDRLLYRRDAVDGNWTRTRLQP